VRWSTKANTIAKWFTIEPHAHKGSIKIIATAIGVAGHSGGRIGESANLKMIPFLAEMKKLRDETESEKEWQNKAFDPPTLSWNICIKDDSPAINVTAGKSTCTMYLRPMPDTQIVPLLEKIRNAAKEFDIVLGQTSKTVPYGTDGGMFSELEHKIVFGPGNIAQAHAIDEWISLEQLEKGTEMFAKMIRRWCCK